MKSKQTDLCFTPLPCRIAVEASPLRRIGFDGSQYGADLLLFLA